MTALRQIQQDMQQYLLSAEQTAQPHVSGPDIDFINLRLSLYSDAYELRLAEILATDFSGVKALVGDDLFEQIASTYIANYPSKYPNARYFGSKFAKFLAEQSSERPELADMATFEWALGQAEDAPDTKLLTQADLAAIPEQAWPELTFQLHPSVQFIELSFNVPAIWQAVLNEMSLPDLQRDNPQTWTIWRHELTAYYHSHSQLELAFLNAVAAGNNFTEICEKLSEHLSADEAVNKVIELLLTFINNQLLIKSAN